VEHCHAEGRIVESIYHHSLQLKERDRIEAEHQQIPRAVSDFREELKFATGDRTTATIVPGMDVVNRLRAHIAYEREMLGRIIGLEATTVEGGLAESKKNAPPHGSRTRRQRVSCRIRFSRIRNYESVLAHRTTSCAKDTGHKGNFVGQVWEYKQPVQPLVRIRANPPC
jgi:hypothetical protein